MYKSRCTKARGNSLPNAPSRVSLSEKNRQSAEEETHPREIELENERSNED